MPTYDWTCGNCGGTTTVFRRMKHCKTPPIADCQGCEMVAKADVFGAIIADENMTVDERVKVAMEIPDAVWVKVFSTPSLNLKEDHNIKSPDGKGGIQRGWPIRVPGLVEQTKRDEQGNVVYVKELVGHDPRTGDPVIKMTPAKEYKDMIFNSPAHQKKWLKDNGMVLTLDGRSASTGNSEHGRYGEHGGDRAPTERAAKMASAGRFMESREIYDMVR